MLCMEKDCIVLTNIKLEHLSFGSTDLVAPQNYTYTRMEKTHVGYTHSHTIMPAIFPLAHIQTRTYSCAPHTTTLGSQEVRVICVTFRGSVLSDV